MFPLLVSSDQYYSNSKTYSHFIGTSNYKILELEDFIQDYPLNINEDLILTDNGAMLIYSFYDFKKSSCIRTYDPIKGYSTTCNIIPFREFSEYQFPENEQIYLITEWKRNPFKYPNQNIDVSRIRIKETLLDSYYKVYLIEILRNEN